MSAPRPVSENAPAKVNLFLHVTGRRSDGFHELDSLVVFAGPGDRVSVAPGAPGEGISLDICGPFAAAIANEPREANLVFRAADRLAEALRRRADLTIALEKNLPVAAGIGGGSADAAACLRALARLWALEDERSPLLERVAAELGADIPACLNGAPSRMQGIGERLMPVEALPSMALLLVNPGMPCPTGAVFAARQAAFSDPAKWEPFDQGFEAFAAWLRGQTRNDLWDPAVGLVPAIGGVLEAIEQQPGCRIARMSGSGATCFGLFADLGAAQRAAQSIAKRHPGWWVSAGMA